MESSPKRELSTEEVQDAQIGLLEWELEHRDAQHGIDHLTGAKNRKVFERELEISLEKVRGEKNERRGAGEGANQISLVFVDLDHFKNINDTYGHPVGDAVLKKVSARLIDLVRKTDVVARVGGEEFVVLLQGADETFAAVGAEKFRAEIEKISFDDAGAPGLAVTASLGVASSKASTDPKVLYGYADKALYRAKHGGRNKVVVHEDNEGSNDSES